MLQIYGVIEETYFFIIVESDPYSFVSHHRSEELF